MKRTYVPPTIDSVEINTEQCFAQSLYENNAGGYVDFWDDEENE